MSSQDKYDNIKKNFPDILKKHYGLVTSACREAGIHRDSYYRWRKESDDFARECDVAYEEAGDFVEGKLIKCINKEDTTAIIFYCKTKLKKRGYVERIETTGADGGAIKQEIDIAATKEQKDALVRMLNG